MSIGRVVCRTESKSGVLACIFVEWKINWEIRHVFLLNGK